MFFCFGSKKWGVVAFTRSSFFVFQVLYVFSSLGVLEFAPQARTKSKKILATSQKICFWVTMEGVPAAGHAAADASLEEEEGWVGERGGEWVVTSSLLSSIEPQT